jgi:hypothetical protein
MKLNTSKEHWMRLAPAEGDAEIGAGYLSSTKTLVRTKQDELCGQQSRELASTRAKIAITLCIGLIAGAALTEIKSAVAFHMRDGAPLTKCLDLPGMF